MCAVSGSRSISPLNLVQIGSVPVENEHADIRVDVTGP